MTADPTAARDAYVTAYAELHELVRRFLAGDANRRTLDRRHAEVELDLRRALGVPPTEPPTVTYDEDAAEEAVVRSVYHEGGAEGAARADLLGRLDGLRAALDVLLDDARTAGWALASYAVDELHDHLAELATDLEEGP